MTALAAAYVLATNFFAQVVDWFRLRENWVGPAGVPNRLLQHVEMSVVALAFSIVLAVPLAVWLGHRRRFGLLAVNVSNVGRALPSFAILAVGTLLFGAKEVPIIGSWFVFVALVAIAVPPMVTNSYVGMVEVPADIRESAQGMGLSDAQSLFRVELPLAVPLIMAGVRTAAVQVVATATIAAVVGSGGLGRYIIDGYSLGPNQYQGEPSGYAELFAGALLVAGLALVTEALFAVLQRAVTAEGLRASRPEAEADVGPILGSVAEAA